MNLQTRLGLLSRKKKKGGIAGAKIRIESAWEGIPCKRPIICKSHTEKAEEGTNSVKRNVVEGSSVLEQVELGRPVLGVTY